MPFMQAYFRKNQENGNITAACLDIAISDRKLPDSFGLVRSFFADDADASAALGTLDVLYEK